MTVLDQLISCCFDFIDFCPTFILIFIKNLQHNLNHLYNFEASSQFGLKLQYIRD
jgi:hypothetical protein